MDHEWKSKDSSSSNPETRQEMEVKDPIAAKKVQKADREKLRRDRLNELFFELGKTIDPDRPKNDKATVLMDTVQMLHDLTAEVNRLKAEYSSLTEESSELTQEKNELREEKASLKADIENLNVQYQQRLSVMFPWTGIDPSVIMAPPYSYPVPLPVATRPIAMHPSLQPYRFFGNHNHTGAIASPCSTFMPYSTTSSPSVEQQSANIASSSHASSKRDSKSKSMDINRDECDDANDVATELELKMPGSSKNQDSSSGETEGKQTQKKEICTASSQDLQDSSSNKMDDASNSDK